MKFLLLLLITAIEEVTSFSFEVLPMIDVSTTTILTTPVSLVDDCALMCLFKQPECASLFYWSDTKVCSLIKFNFEAIHGSTDELIQRIIGSGSMAIFTNEAESVG